LDSRGRFEDNLRDVFELQDRVTASVVGAIAPKLEQVGIDRARRKPTESLDAYDYYLRGISCFHRGHWKDLSEALELFQKAIDLDSDFACAYGMAAWCISVQSGHWLATACELEAAGRLAKHAARLGQEDATALYSAAFALTHREPPGSDSPDDPNCRETRYPDALSPRGQRGNRWHNSARHGRT
jgi:tetratricopeptide (TPR) repeat protein